MAAFPSPLPASRSPPIDLGFQPCRNRASAVDADVRARLADSIDHIVDALTDDPRVDTAALRSLTASVRTHAVRPGVMVLYAETVPALVQGEDGEVEAALAMLAHPMWRDRATSRVVTFDDGDLGPGMAARYQRQLQDDPDSHVQFGAVRRGALEDARLRVADAGKLLAAVAPELDAEIGALVPEIIMVEGQAEPGGLVFHGASGFYVWGALALNLAEHGTRVKLVEGVVHEAAHSLLHGFTLGGPLVENDPDERHQSPLRDDPRPMEGLVHAAYVLARMHLAMSAIEGSPSAAAAERQEAGDRRASAARGFRAGLTTIARQARFTGQGRAIFAGAEAYMAEAEGIRRPG